jgi:glutathione reductase (NADPH)
MVTKKSDKQRKSMRMTDYDYDFDLFVIGGGSGGVRAGRVVASTGKRVGIAEEYRFGGTCVIRGCVPKKLMVYASEFSAHFKAAQGFGWDVGTPSFDWAALIAAQATEVTRLEGLYTKGLVNNNAHIFETRAELVSPHTVKLLKDGKTVTAQTIIIATGGRPNKNVSLKGAEFCITSNEVFELAELPQSIVVEGGGYIALEFASIFNGLGTKVTVVYRGDEILSRFDIDVRQGLRDAFVSKGIDIITQATLTEVTRAQDQTLHVQLSNGQCLNADQVMLAIGRVPNTQNLGLEQAGVLCDDTGAITVDDYCRTSNEHIFALGDVTNRVQLTPVAIHEAMCVIETVYKNNPTRPDYEFIASGVFTRPEIGTVGLSEEQATLKYADLDIYRAQFRPMKASLSGSSDKILMKLIVDALSQKIVGAHIMGSDAAEMIQIIAITLKMGAKKSDFDQTMAVHPTAAEELVTLYTPTYKIRNGVRAGQNL